MVYLKVLKSFRKERKIVNKKYTTTLNTRPFMYRETKLIASLIDEGLDEDLIKVKVVEDNVLGLQSKDRRNRFYHEIKKRLGHLDDFLFEHFLVSDSQTSKLILLYAISSKDTLFYEWMREVVLDKWLTLDYVVHRQDSLTFFDKKVEQDERVKKWKDNTREKLASAYHKILVDAEYASSENEQIRLQRPIIAPDVERYLKSNKEKQLVEVLLGEVMQ